MHPIYHLHTDLDMITDRVGLGDIFAFDIDGTLTEPNEHITHEQASALKRLSDSHPVIILTARDHHTIYEHILKQMPEDTHWENWYLASANGGQIYRYKENQTNWHEPLSLYEMPEKDREKIKNTFDHIKRSGALTMLHPGSTIEDRLTNLTIVIYPRSIYDESTSTYIKTPATLRNQADPDRSLRSSIISLMQEHLPDITYKYDWHIGGATSIDIKDPLAVKGPNLAKLIDTHQWQEKHIVFFGDEVTQGGDQSIPYMTHEHLTTIEVKSPNETYKVLSTFLS